MSEVGKGKPPVETRFKPGQSGNPAGRPPGIPNAKTRYQRILNLIEKVKNPVTGEIEDFTVAEIMDMKIMQKARGGDLAAYKEIMDRLEGKAQQNIDMTVAVDERKAILEKYMGDENVREVKET